MNNLFKPHVLPASPYCPSLRPLQISTRFTESSMGCSMLLSSTILPPRSSETQSHFQSAQSFITSSKFNLAPIKEKADLALAFVTFCKTPFLRYSLVESPSLSLYVCSTLLHYLNTYTAIKDSCTNKPIMAPFGLLTCRFLATLLVCRSMVSAVPTPMRNNKFKGVASMEHIGLGSTAGPNKGDEEHTYRTQWWTLVQLK
jgi:hypothetical protein